MPPDNHHGGIKRGDTAPEEQFLLLSIIFCYLMLDLYVRKGIRFSLRDKRLFEITEVEITRVDCIAVNETILSYKQQAVLLQSENMLTALPDMRLNS